MKQSPYPNDRPLDDDIAAMCESILALNEAGIPFNRPTRHQIKVGAWNFYPAKGKMFRDGCEPEVARGVGALIERVRGGNWHTVQKGET